MEKMNLILDIGSGRSISNYYTGKKIIDSVAEIDKGKHNIIFKAQLFNDIPPNRPLSHETFKFLHEYAADAGYKMTASVFDEESLAFLLMFSIPFIKIAANPKYRYLVERIPRGIPIYASNYCGSDRNMFSLACIPKYPATIEEYLQIPWLAYYDGISDHTVGWDLYRFSNPFILEKHYVLSRSPDNPDSGPFAVTQEELKEIM